MNANRSHTSDCYVKHQ